MKILRLLAPINFNYFSCITGTKFIISSSQEELEKIGRIRKEVFVDSSYVRPEEVPDIWLDEYDKTAVNFYAKKKGKIIGVVRLVPKKQGEKMPIERYFNLRSEIPENSLEVSKLAVIREYRGRSRIIFIGLLQQMVIYCKKNKVENLVMFMPEWLFGSLKKMKVDIRQLETNELTENEIKERYVMRNYYSKQTINPYIFKI